MVSEEKLAAVLFMLPAYLNNIVIVEETNKPKLLKLTNASVECFVNFITLLALTHITKKGFSDN